MENGDQNYNGCCYSLRSCLNFHVISPVKTNITITTMKTIGLKQSVAENNIKLEHVSSNVFFISKVFQKKNEVRGAIHLPLVKIGLNRLSRR